MPRGKAQKTIAREEAILEWAEAHHPVTVRQLFYRLSVLGLVQKTEGGYDSVYNICKDMRLDGDIPFEWFSDEGRSWRKPKTYNSWEDALKQTAEVYRKSLWNTNDDVVEIWIEKEALLGVVIDVTSTWDVALLPVKGYASLTALYICAENIKRATEAGKTFHLYYFGDHDPSGLDIYRDINDKLQKFVPDGRWSITRPAVTKTQIEEMQLPSRPTKKEDSRAKNFEGKSVELDAIEPDILRSMVRKCIFNHLDYDEADRLFEIEKLEQQNIFDFLNFG